MKPRLIGLAGRAGAGKDTVGDILMGYGYTRYAFARPLKQALAAIGLPEPVSREDRETPIPGLGVSWRHAAQTLGTEWAREHISKDFWLWLAGQKIGGNPYTVITDVRFANEAQWILTQGGTIWMIDRGTTDASAVASMHASEQLDLGVKPDVLINNTGTRDDLTRLVSRIMHDYKEAV